MDIVGLLCIVVGLLLSKYFSAAANFGVMVTVFELGIFTEVFMITGEFRPRILLPYTVVGVIPAIVGIFGRRRLGRVTNFVLMVTISYLLCVLLVFVEFKELRPFSFPQKIFLSVLDLVPLVAFLGIALIASIRHQHPLESTESSARS